MKRVVKILPKEKWYENGWDDIRDSMLHETDGGYHIKTVNKIQNETIPLEYIKGEWVYNEEWIIQESIIEKDLNPEDYPEYFI